MESVFLGKYVFDQIKCFTIFEHIKPKTSKKCPSDQILPNLETLVGLEDTVEPAQK